MSRSPNNSSPAKPSAVIAASLATRAPAECQAAKRRTIGLRREAYELARKHAALLVHNTGRPFSIADFVEYAIKQAVEVEIAPHLDELRDAQRARTTENCNSERTSGGAGE